MTAAQTGSGLRSRKVDPKRAMQVVRFDQVDDLDESSMIHRAIPQISTGVEKEEEEVLIDLRRNITCKRHWLLGQKS
jgi:hypothetical protein